MSITTFRSLARQKVLRLAVGCTLGAFALTVSARAADAGAAKAGEKSAPALPLSSSFEKAGEGKGPYVLKLKNTSSAPLKVSGKVLLSVAFHADSKARSIPEHTIPAGGSWTIEELAAKDIVVLDAAGFAELKLTVP